MPWSSRTKKSSLTEKMGLVADPVVEEETELVVETGDSWPSR